MADMMFVAENDAPPTTRRGRQAKVLRGHRRTQVRNLKRLLQAIIRADSREAARGERLGYTPFLFARPGPNGNAMMRLSTRCIEALEARVG